MRTVVSQYFNAAVQVAAGYSAQQDWAGEEIETVTNVGMPWAGHPAGEVVPVMYDPADPTHAEIDTPGRRGLLTVLGLLMLPGGLALVVVGIMRLIQA